MILISHRGNIHGPNPSLENSPEYILLALEAGFDVEVDVWYNDIDGYWLGHDEPQYQVDERFLMNPSLWCHAKNLEALTKMINYDYIHCFWHENDKYTLTSVGYIWTFPREKLSIHSIAVYPELYPDGTDFTIAAGICSDYISIYK